MKKSTVVGVIMATTALVMGAIYFIRIDFSIQLESYFSLAYLMQFTPLIISLMLFIGGFLLVKRMPKANFYLALFGADTLEEVIFHWFGLINSNLGSYAMFLFFFIALAALWMAYSNVFNLKKMSIKEVLLSIALGALISLFPYYI